MASTLTPTMLGAARDGDADTIAKILAQGTSPNATNEIGQSSLHIAAIWDRVKAANVLLDAGANVNIKNQFGETPLHFAVSKNHERMVRLLLERGAKIVNRDRLLEKAQGRVRELLLSPPSAKLLQTIKTFDMEGLRALLEEGADLMENDSSGATAFHLAALAAVAAAEGAQKTGGRNKEDGLGALRMLVEEAQRRDEGFVCAVCNELDDDGNTPLHIFLQALRLRSPCSRANVCPASGGRATTHT
mgnify:CR=1 FL=1